MPNDSFWLLKRLRLAVMMAPVVAVASTAAADESQGPTSQPTSMPTEEPSVDLEPDTDEDGIPDLLDDCPEHPGGTDGVNNGCPDEDGDGVPDLTDFCPEHAEEMNGVNDYDGCPDDDRDGDGVPDVIDECPDFSGGGLTGCEVEMRPRGRPMIAADGQILRPDSRAAQPLASVSRSASLPAHTRAWIANRWLDDARLEYGSVASFARAALELMMLGAPPELVAGYHEAALDEIRHAERCFEHASEYAGRELSPGPMRVEGPRHVGFVELAVHTFQEACIDETTATLCASRQAAQCIYPDIRETLDMIVEDEARHAAIAWKTVRWALEHGGEPVRVALLETAATRRVAYDLELSSALDTSVDTRTLRRHGRLSPDEEAKAAREAWERVVEPLLAELLVV